MPLTAPELRTSLSRKFGFAEAGSGRGPHDKYRLEVEGQYLAHTQVPRGRAEIGDKLHGMIARQLGVTSRELTAMIGCTLSRESYIERLTR